MVDPQRGEVWLARLDPSRGHERGGARPVLVVSDDRFNRGGSGLVFVVPLSTREHRVRYHVRVEPPEGGLRHTSYAMCEHTRSISRDRLTERWGAVGGDTLDAVADLVRVLLAL